MNELRRKKNEAHVFFILGENQKMNFTFGHIKGLQNRGATIIQSSLHGWYYWDVNVVKEVERIPLPDHLLDMFEDPSTLKFTL